MGNDRQKVLLIDGNSIVYRAFFAMPPLTNSSGLHTNAVFGFTTMLLKVMEEEKPTHLLVAFDAGKVTFRHEGYGEYKGGRQKTPPELSEQFPLLKELLSSFSIAQFELGGYEADDIIGTLSRMAEEKDIETVVVSGDKDMLQLASEKVTVLLTRKGVSEVERYSPEAVGERYGLTPQQIIDLKGLMGDASDNIPGIPGVGEKTALKLLAEYGTVENVLAHMGEIKGKLGENVRAHEEDARMSKRLATIFREVPLERTLDELRWSGYDAAELAAALRKLEFKSLIERLDLSAAAVGAADADAAGAAAGQAAYETVWVAGAADWQALNEALPQAEALLVESHGDNPHQGEGIGLGIAAEGCIFVVPYAALASEEAKPLRDWLADEQAAKTGYDLHRAELVLARSGIALRGLAFDVQLAAYLLDPTEADPSLVGLLQRHGLPVIAADEAVFGKGAKFRVPEDEALAAHLAAKTDAIRRLAAPLAEELDKAGMRTLYYELEQPLSVILAGMEKQGISVRAEALEELGKEFQVGIERTMAEIYRLAGCEFNIGSTRQLGEVLFDKLGLPVIKKTKTGYSTDAEVLEKLEPYHEIVRLILHYRTLTKLQSTYIEGLLKEIRPEDGKIHTYYRQTIAATGRLSSQYPNLQNIPIRLEEGRQIRKAFVPSEEGWLILAADYSQIELRVLAHISGDEGLKEAFRNEMDVHTKTAMDVFGVTADQVDSNMRRQAKAVNFGIVYGISDYGLSQNLNITRKEAAAFIDQYFGAFPGVRRYMDDIVAQAKQDGYVTTLLERRRYLPDIRASNFNLRSFAERTAMNTPIQGTAADIIKLAMVRMDETLKSRGLRSRMLLQVHDELVFEVPPEELEMMKELVPKVMAEAFPLDVPLKADVNFGVNWYEAK
ncbi:DNA polymerase I [Cohnella lubricantis]|uniref:DNA polymerase I n=1 Tax=Cohnella lubricantis TaxID=2163172 RepID=A0A841T3X8_9BACL|nr:DNA polymerase I [Cohnella lubricantis]MBB6676044.1 DNA polymerase I [Cohnella lubricantis]MBP2117998.1 DNA polymerase-1 [Cohnella lubricantis]